MSPRVVHIRSGRMLAIVLALAVAILVCAPDRSVAAGSDTPTKSAASADSSKSKEKPTSIEDEKLDSKVFGGASKDPGKAAPKPGGSGAMMRLFFGLIIVLGTIFGIHWFLKKYGQGKMSGGVIGRGDAIEVMATTPLAPNRSLHLVRVGQEMVLIGATEQSISRIGDVDAALLAAQPVTGSGEFQMELQGALAGTQTRSGAASGSNQTFLQRFIQNLQMMTAR